MPKKKRDQWGKNKRRMMDSFQVDRVGTGSENVGWIHLAEECR
jgi:hypothetical protein